MKRNNKVDLRKKILQLIAARHVKYKKICFELICGNICVHMSKLLDPIQFGTI